MRALTAGLVALQVLTPTLAAGSAADGGPGCAPDRPAIAHHAGGVVLDPQPAGGPVPCGVSTGFPASENRIGVTRSGAVIYSPALTHLAAGVDCPYNIIDSGCAGVAVTTDDGRIWRAILPPGPQGTPGTYYAMQDHQMYSDKDTGRFFWTNPVNPGGQTAVVFTDDDGRTWTYSQACCSGSENPRPVSAVAPAGHPEPRGYPKVVYLCANVAGWPVAVAVNAGICSKSLDGGMTWIQLGQGLSWRQYMPAHYECLGAFDEHAGYPAPASNGSLYTIVTCGGKSFLARSDDEAATWPIVRQIERTGELRTDAEDNLYVVRAVPNAAPARVLLSVSRDEGLSWSPEIDVLAPGVTVINRWFVAVGAPGHVAVSYYGQRPDQTAFDGYLTETLGAFDAEPVFWSGQLNDPSRPLLRSTTYPLFNDYNGVDIAPDGTAWAGFQEACGSAQTDPGCITLQHSTKNDFGFAGRLKRG
jgi:hypothetical protein